MMAASLDLIASPYREVRGTSMRRVTQFDLYMLGTVRSLLNLKVGDKISAHRETIVLSYIALSGFSDDSENASLLRESVAAARYLRTQVAAINAEMGGSGPSGGVLLDSMCQILSRLLHAFEASLKIELNNLPTYVIEQTGIYRTDKLMSSAEQIFPPTVLDVIPQDVTDDFKKAGSCLAFDLFTACGFHAYRSLDAMLRQYYVHFAPDGADTPKRRDWGAFIGKLRDFLRSPPAKGNGRPNQRTVELIDRIRDEDRNPLMHPEQDLNKDEAIRAFELCKSTIMCMAMDMRP
jgi:hypothetical protein